MRIDGLKLPVFIVGCGRSGTTIVYELLCEHPDFAWFSSYAERWPAFPQLEALTRLRDIGAIRRSSSRLAPPRSKATIFGIGSAHRMRGTATPRSPRQTSTPNMCSG